VGPAARHVGGAGRVRRHGHRGRGPFLAVSGYRTGGRGGSSTMPSGSTRPAASGAASTASARRPPPRTSSCAAGSGASRAPPSWSGWARAGAGARSGPTRPASRPARRALSASGEGRRWSSPAPSTGRAVVGATPSRCLMSRPRAGPWSSRRRSSQGLSSPSHHSASDLI
jgi:hypothetical protein